MPPYLEAPLLALARGLYDRGQGVPEERAAWAVNDLGSFLEHAGRRTSLLLAVATLVLEWCPLFFIGAFSRMSRLSNERLSRYLERFDRSRLALVLMLPKALLSLVYYEHPDAIRETGYDGQCLLGELPKDVGLVQLRKRAGHDASAARSEPKANPCPEESLLRAYPGGRG
jgi:hypothetical protein